MFNRTNVSFAIFFCRCKFLYKLCSTAHCNNRNFFLYKNIPYVWPADLLSPSYPGDHMNMDWDWFTENVVIPFLV